MKTASEASRQTLKAVIDTTDREIDARVYTPLKRRITGVSTLWLRITSPMAASSNACKKCAAFSVKRSSNPYRLIATPTWLPIGSTLPYYSVRSPTSRISDFVRSSIHSTVAVAE